MKKEKMEYGKFKQCFKVALVKLRHCSEVAGSICHLYLYCHCHIHLAENVQLLVPPLVLELFVLPVPSADIYVAS